MKRFGNHFKKWLNTRPQKSPKLPDSSYPIGRAGQCSEFDLRHKSEMCNVVKSNYHVEEADELGCKLMWQGEPEDL